MSTPEHIAVQMIRMMYQEGDILAHYSDPMRNISREDLCRWELSLAQEYVPDKGHILVIGCAGGQESFAFVRAGYRVTGLDIVPESVAAANRYAEEHGLENLARFEVTDGYRWPIADDSCDAVSMMANLLHHLPTRAIRNTLFNECVRVLHVGGIVMMEGIDRTHPEANRERQPWEPDRTEDTLKKSAWGLTDEPGASVVPFHPCKGHVNANTIVPSYRPDPRELWDEVAACGLRVVRLQSQKSPHNPLVTLVAEKAASSGV